MQAGGARDGEGLNLFNLPVAAHLSKCVTAPKFTGKKEDWPCFVRKYEQWHKIVIGTKVLSDVQQVQLFSACLPENLQKELQLLEIENRRSPTYIECRAKFEAIFGRAQSENMRKKWMEVQISHHAGRFNAQMFSDFRVNFKLALADVPDANPDEARRVLMDKLHPFMRRWVIDAETKRQREHPIVEFNIGVEIPLAKVRDSVQEMVDAAPRRVETRGGGVYYLHFDGEKYADLLLHFHGRSFGNGRGKSDIHTVEQHLTVDEIFNEVSHQLNAQERNAEGQKRGPLSTQIRKADVHSEKKTKFDTPPASPMLPKSGGGGSTFRPVQQSGSSASTTVNSTAPKATVPVVAPPPPQTQFVHNPYPTSHVQPAEFLPQSTAVSAPPCQMPPQYYMPQYPMFQHPYGPYYAQPFVAPHWPQPTFPENDANSSPGKGKGAGKAKGAGKGGRGKGGKGSNGGRGRPFNGPFIALPNQQQNSGRGGGAPGQQSQAKPAAPPAQSSHGPAQSISSSSHA